MSAPTQSISAALTKSSRVVLSNHSAADLRVASISAGPPVELTVDDSSILTGQALYTATEPGLLVVKSGQATADEGLVSEVTDITGNVLTLGTDLSGDLADGDIVFVAPPHAIELLTNGPHSLQVNAPNQTDKGVGEVFLTHNSPDVVDISGDIPFFFQVDSESLPRLIMAAMGSYKLDTSTHTIRFKEDDDGTFTDADEYTVYSSEGNATLEEIYGGLFATGLTITLPESGAITGSLSSVGSSFAAEVGGTGKTFPASGASSYVNSGVPADGGQRHSRSSAFVQFGGSFGAALGDADHAVTNLTITISRTEEAPRGLGSAYTAKGEESEVNLTVSGSRILVDNAIRDDFRGGESDPDCVKSTTRMLVSIVSCSDATKNISFDMPLGARTSTLDRSRGSVKEDFEFTAHHTLSSGKPDTANPLCEVTCNITSTSDLTSTLP